MRAANMYHVIKNKENLIHETEDHPGKVKKERQGDQKKKNIRRKYKVEKSHSEDNTYRVGRAGFGRK